MTVRKDEMMHRTLTIAALAACLALASCRGGAGYRSNEDSAPASNPNAPSTNEQAATSPVPQTPPPAPAAKPANPPAAAKPDGSAPKSGSKSRTGFFRKLNEENEAPFADACRAMSILFFDEDKGDDFKQNRAVLVSNNVVPKSWTYQAESPLTKGMISYMLCRALGIRGGVLLFVIGTTQRYGLRECVWDGLVIDGNIDQYITGGELLAILSRAEGFKKYGFVPGYRGRQEPE